MKTKRDRTYFGIRLSLLLAVAVAWLCPLSSLHGQEGMLLSETLTIRFRLDKTDIDMDFDGNGERWQEFLSAISERYSNVSPRNLRLDIYAGASPEGSAAHNRWLGENRGQAIRRLIRQQLGRKVGSIVVHNEGARWDELYDLVAASDEPWRDEVLAIIELPASSNENERDHREAKLRSLQDGKVWPLLLENYLAPLRSGASATLSWMGGRDTVIIRDTVVIVNNYYGPGGGDGTGTGDGQGAAGMGGRDGHWTLVVGQGGDGRSQAQARRDSLHRELLGQSAWAVKTNFLFWGLGTPNVQVEVPLGRSNRWSLEAEYFMTKIIWSKNAHCNQAHNIGLELRYWIGRRHNRLCLQGWHIGAAAAVGYYDLEWKKHEGYQGEYLNTYLNIGYQRRWGSHWGMDAGVGFGALHTKYRHYYGSSVYPDNRLEEWDKHLIWHDSDRYQWFGPCHANLSICYFFNARPFHTKTRKLNADR